MWKAIQFVACQGLEYYWEIILGNKAVVQDLGYSARVFQGCASMVIPHSQQFTISFSNGILLKLWIYFPHLMTILIWLKTLGSWQQCIWDKQRKKRPMWDIIKLQKICGMIIRGYLEKCELFCCHWATQYYEIQTFTFFQIQQQNKDMRKVYKVNRSPSGN